MATINQIKRDRMFIGKLAYGQDLIEEITGICRQENIRLGRIEALGAVQKATLGFYDQQTKSYQFHTIDAPLEITNLVGNISLKDGDPIVHAHVTLADAQGHAFGGHLAPGTVIFACEILIEALDGPALDRGLDEQTGLPLWSMTQ